MALKCGVVGMGPIGNTHARSYQNDALSELVGVCDINKERADKAASEYGVTVPGIVRSVESYGIFVELAPNLAGLAEYCDGIYPGQHASVYIKSITPEKMKIKLVIIDAFDADYKASEPCYFFTGSHMDEFVYSSVHSERDIRTVF